MFVYEKKLQYPVNIKTTNPKLAALIISQYGGPYSSALLKRNPDNPSAFLILSMILENLGLLPWIMFRWRSILSKHTV